MNFCCSQCSFTAQFESALLMHHQLHHETQGLDVDDKLVTEKSRTIPRATTDNCYRDHQKELKLPTLPRTSSATRLFGKIRAKICRSRMLFSHPEEADHGINDLSAHSECTSKALKMESISRCSNVTCLREQRESYICHLCDFEADRITVLDRHLLNDHKIGLNNLLKLVLTKTKENLNEDLPNTIFGLKQPYYKPQDDIIEEGEFVIETVLPKIKILKHTSTNTDNYMIQAPDIKDNCRMISDELDKMKFDVEKCGKDELLDKMQTLNACMCKFVDSSNALKNVLNKQYGGKRNGIGRSMHLGNDVPIFEFGLGDQESPHGWERAHSEQLERNRTKYGETKCRSEKTTKLSSAESYYF